jgi:hypothetical protein
MARALAGKAILVCEDEFSITVNPAACAGDPA